MPKQSLGVRFMCLGVLSFGKGSGYQIRRTILESFGHFQNASLGALYPAIGKLLAEGRIAAVDEKSGPLERRVYQITQAGLDELQDQLKAPPAGEDFRSEFLTAMYFAHLMDNNTIVSLIDSRLGALQEEQRRLLNLPISQMSEGQRFTVRYRQAMTRAAIDFLHYEGRAIVTAIDRTTE